jgi:molybdopterin biosynthesis enzyme
MAHANGLIICPSGVVRINTGTIVEVALLDILEHLGGIIE